MEERFVMIRSNNDGTFDFIPGKDGKDQTIPEEKVEEYDSFWDLNNQVNKLSFKDLVLMMDHFWFEEA